MAHPSSEGKELESVKIARKALEESIMFGWLDSDHFAKVLGVEARSLTLMLDGGKSKAVGFDVGDGMLGSWGVGDGMLDGWEVGDGVHGGWGVGNGHAGKDYYYIQAKTGARGVVLWRTIILKQAMTLQEQSGHRRASDREN